MCFKALEGFGFNLINKNNFSFLRCIKCLIDIQKHIDGSWIICVLMAWIVMDFVSTVAAAFIVCSVPSMLIYYRSRLLYKFLFHSPENLFFCCCWIKCSISLIVTWHQLLPLTWIAALTILVDFSLTISFFQTKITVTSAVTCIIIPTTKLRWCYRSTHCVNCIMCIIMQST